MSQSSYTDRQIQFIMDMRVSGYTFAEIAEMFEDKFGERKTIDAISSTFRRYMNEFELPEIEKHPDKQRKEKMEEIMENYLEFIENNKFVPTQSDLAELGFSMTTIRNYFGSYDALEEKARELHPRVFRSVIDEYSFTDEEFNKLKDNIKNFNRFVITTAVTGCEVHEAGLNALKNYCKKNKAMLLVLPCSDPASNRKHKWSLDYRLSKDAVVFRDINLNEKVFLSTIKLSAKHINPLTGLSRIGQRSGSFIYASPKQFLEYVATSNDKKIPRALMTTGAITKPQYQTEKYMSERTAYIANHDHILGGIVVEIKDDKKFFFRQLQIEPRTGAFIDLDKKYFADGRVEKSKADLVQLGDYHVGETCPQTKEMARQICELVKPDYLTVEDFFNGHSISHHDEGKFFTQAVKSQNNLNSLHVELTECQKEINDLLSWDIGKLVFKYGNHEDFIFRWLERAGYVEQPQNHKLGLQLALSMFDYWAPFEYAMKKLYPIKDQERTIFLTRDESFKIKGIENGAHGDQGPNGKRNPSMTSLEKCYGACNVGHNHTAGIIRNVFRVGTSSHLKVSYNEGPSSWTQTHLIQHPNGSRQLINNIDGEWKL